MIKKGQSRKKREPKAWSKYLIGGTVVLTAGIVCVCLIGLVRSRGKEHLSSERLWSRERGNDSENGLQGGKDTNGAEGQESRDRMAEEQDAGRQTEWAREILDQMTMEEKAAQLFIITPEQLTGGSQVTVADETIREALKQYPVGGLIYFSGNLVDPAQLKEMTSHTQAYAMEHSGIPLFLSIDEEGGDIARIGTHEGFQVEQVSAMAEIGASGDWAMAYDAGNTIGTYLREYGINVDFAPDADVLTNPDNTVVKTRSFGTDPELVTKMSLAYLDGLTGQGVYGVPKHFPGHGATKGDSHQGYAYADKTWEELEKTDLVPFYAMAERQVPFIMAGHISLPGITGEDVPCSLSGEALQGYLREKMGYEGIIITDALNMGAIQEHYPSGQAAVMAFKAGADMLLMPADFHAAYEEVVRAVRDGEISVERLDGSVLRILKVKAGLSGSFS